ncbi:hypothetical protein FRC07_001918 [Ceratobasidium sp. 392]|nr:hypothetical protein FRC07_001918 [Ceratobasidium sp. 392]
MATGMDPAYDFLYAPSSSSIHQPHVPGADPSLATEIMPAPPPLTGFSRTNEKGQALSRAGKVSHKKKPPGLGTIVAHVSRPQQQRLIAPVEPVPAVIPRPSSPPPAVPSGETSESLTAMVESSGARKRMRLSRQPSIPTSLGTRASSRQLRGSPLTTEGNSVTPEPVASPQPPPITDLEPSVTAMANGTSPGMSFAPHTQPKRPRGKKSHPFTSRGPSPLITRDAGLPPTGVKPEPTDDPFISHTDPPPPLEVYDSSFAGAARFDGMQLGVHRTPSAKPTLSSRRKGKGKDIGFEAGDHEDGYPQSNNVTCEGCSLQGGHLVFCDGCPRSFHLLCLNPPLDELQEETWYCQSCTAKRSGLKPPPPKFRLETSTKRVNINGLFDELMYNLASESPKVFGLPEDIRAHFKDGKSSSSNSGAYIDSGDVVRERLSRHGFVEERDPYRLRDRHGAMVLCCKCGMSASSSTMNDDGQSTGDPPLAVLPVNGRRWMCPNHAAHSVPKIRIPKSGSRVVTITKPGQRNNGNIEVIMDSEPLQLIPQVMRAAYEEVRINGQRYRVPEQTIILDFWKKAKQDPLREVPNGILVPAPPPPIRSATPGQSSPGIITPSSSPLTSLSSLSDHEDDDLESAHPHQQQGMGDLAAAEEAASSSLSPGPIVSQPPRSPANGIKIIPKAGSFAIRIPASKTAARSVVRESSQPRRSGRHRLSLPPVDPSPSNMTNAKTPPYNRQEAIEGHNSSASAMDDDLSPAEIAKLKKIKALILAKGEDELMKFLHS